jgi:hypothetical protein
MTGVAETTRAGEASTEGERRGVVSAFLDAVYALPWHGWWVFPVMALAILGWGLAVLWMSGNLATGAVALVFATAVPYGPFQLFGVAIARVTSARALDDFWPATGWPDAERADWHHRFAYAPPAWEAIAFVVGGFAGFASLLASPVVTQAPDDARAAVILACLPGFVLGYAVGGVAIVLLVRWAWLVSRIHGLATAIDPFDPGPIHAFSRLTSMLGLFALVIVYYSFSVNAANQTGNIPSLAFLATAMVLGTAAFVVPLWGIHQRLTAEKDRLALEVESRTTAVTDELYARIDAGDLAATEVVEHALVSLGTVRQRIAAIPTWPWSPQLFRGFVSALVLPIAVFVVTRLIGVVLEL